VKRALRRFDSRRLRFSQPLRRDAPAMFARYASDPDVTRYVGWRSHTSVATTKQFVQFSADQWDRDGVGAYLIWSRADGRLLGSTGLELDASGSAMTGYVLAKDAWGHGFATEALLAMIHTAEGIGIPRLYAFCHPDHTASQHVLEKCQFERDPRVSVPIEFPNLAPGLRQDVLCYVLMIDRTPADRSVRS
jgi:RimJ/RimL family protein N-acetyltransferase